ncbi:MAG: HDOD domain-containing protein [Myxococcales bacterium]|nr:HDOD domain-containing protein [Myxococcales bacterium]
MTVVEVGRALGDPDVSLRAVATILERDPRMTGALLGLANSAFFGFPRAIRTPLQAVTLLGVRQVRSLVVSLSATAELARVCDGVDFGRFLEHAVACSQISRFITEAHGEAVPDEVAVAATLHDMGQVLLVGADPAAWAELSRTARGVGGPWVDAARLKAERDAFGVDHARLGGLLAEKWRLPVDLVAVVRDHHEPTAPDRSAAARALALADHLATVFGFGGLAEDCQAGAAFERLAGNDLRKARRFDRAHRDRGRLMERASAAPA